MKRRYKIRFNDWFHTPKDEEWAELQAPLTPKGRWSFYTFWEFKNSTALAMARFIAKFNGYRLVKEPKEEK